MSDSPSARRGAPTPPTRSAGTPGPAPPELRAELGLRDVAGFLIVAVASPRWIATAAAAGPASLTLWLVGLVAFFLPLAFTTLELSSRMPEEGGIYAWVRHSFGDFAAFLAAWMYWASNLVYFPGLLYFTVGNALGIAGRRGDAWANHPAWFVGASLAALAIALVANVRGVRTGTRLHNLAAIATWVPVAMLVGLAAAAFATHGAATPITARSLVPAPGLEHAIFASSLAFAFAGLEAASLMGEEIRDARRTLPRAILLAGLGILALYMLGTAAALVALPSSETSELSGIVQAIARAGERLGFPAAGPIAAALLTLSGIGAVGAWLASVARLPFVAGLDRHLPPAFGRLHPRWGTPVAALVAQAAGTAVFVVLGQAGTSVRAAYDAFVRATVIVYFVPYVWMFATLIAVQREPAGAGVRRVPGGPWMARLCASVGLVTTLASIGLSMVPARDAPSPALDVLRVVGGSLGLALVGAWLYAAGRRRRAPAP